MRMAELLVGERVRLSAFRKDDEPTIARWYEDAGFMRLLDGGIARPGGEEQVHEMLDEWRKSQRDVAFAVRRLGDDALVGMAAVEEIQWNHRTAWISLGLGPEFWDQGLGTEVVALLLRYAFDELNLHRLSLSVFAYNERAQAVYRRAGFRQEGTWREALLRDGQRYDMLLMGILEHEWRALGGG